MVRWLLVISYILGIFLFTARPQSGARAMSRYLLRFFPFLEAHQLSTIVFWSRKAIHLLAYYILTWLIFSVGRKTSYFRERPYLTTFIFTSFIALGDEYFQGRLPYRSGQLEDVVLDLVGAGMALLILWQKSRREQKVRLE
jgi:VanZ family protein